MTLEELKKLPNYEIKLGTGSPLTGEDGKKVFFQTCNIQIFDNEKKMQLKSVSGVLGQGASQEEAESAALEKACELLGEI